tara:strand:+ start:1669 stop:2226 length:558 start_codon:yes stop_codon:yes gene_type:complete
MRPKIFIPIRRDQTYESLNRIRDKNGIPLWINFLRSLNEFELFIDTDSTEIEKAINEDSDLEASAYQRDESLLGDHVTTNDLIGHFIERYRIQHETLVQTHLTHPFLNPETLFAAWERLTIDSTFDSILSCTRDHARLWSHDTKGFFPINHNPISLRRTDDATGWHLAEIIALGQMVAKSANQYR